jgi:thiamine-monophosphate kinase
VALAEFELISRYFAHNDIAFPQAGLALGIGDDCALLEVAPGYQLAVSMDTLNEGVHFPRMADPYLLGQRCLLVNLSDLAAMGAEPLAFTLAISLPVVNEVWLEGFSRGLASVAKPNRCSLAGGDTTQGPLSITIQVHGRVPTGQALRRDGAKPGDAVYVTGTLGDAAAALCWMQGSPEFCLDGLDASGASFLEQAFYAPAVRIEAGAALRGLASAGLDLSDGLASDLRHILSAGSSQAQPLGAVIDIASVPLSEVFRRHVRQDKQLALALAGGDDYELCVTVTPVNETRAVRALAQAGIPFTRIGVIDSTPGIRLKQNDGTLMDLAFHGYQHFQGE